jgi:hypothetical protein
MHATGNVPPRNVWRGTAQGIPPDSLAPRPPMQTRPLRAAVIRPCSQATCARWGLAVSYAVTVQKMTETTVVDGGKNELSPGQEPRRRPENRLIEVY